MIFSVYMLSIGFSILFLLVIIEMVRKNKLLEKYSLLWIFFGVILLLLSSTPVFIERIAGLMDIKYAPSVLFLFGMVYLIVYCFHITMVFSKQSEKITRLNQELAILKEKLENDKQNKEGGQGG
ncbi:MAG: DUF2304 domain-containing protein [Clostridia bacterium]|nr:DUF2304 domain-containing protein [Clostridia bacterium]